MRRLVSLVPLAAVVLFLAACSTPLLLPAEVRIDAITPTTGAAGTDVVLTGLFTDDVSVEVCGLPVTNLSFSGSERGVVAPGMAGAGPGYLRATGTIPAAVPAGTACGVIALVEGERTGSSAVTFTTDASPAEPAPEEPAPEEPAPEEPTVEGIVVFPSTENLVVGSFTQFSATRTDTSVEVTADVTWSSSNTDVATVSNDLGSEGLVTAVAPGTVTIRAESELGSGTGVVTVVPTLLSVDGVAVSDAATASIGHSNTSRNVAVDRDLTVHVAWVDTSVPAVRYSRSVDYGASFEASQEIFAGPSLTSAPEASIATNGRDAAYIAFVDASSDLRVARSTNSGATWSEAEVWASNVRNDQLSLATFEDNVYVAVLSNSSGGTELVRSTDRGVTRESITTPLGSLAYWDVLVDPRNGDVHLIGDTPTIHHTVSRDGGTTFTPVVTAASEYGVYFSDYSISQLGSILITGRDGGTTLFDIDEDTWSSVPTGTAAQPNQASAAIDGANVLHVISNSSGSTVQLSVSVDDGATYTTVDVAPGTQQDIAPSTFVVGSPLIYNDGGVIRYSFLPN